ncbi:MAG: pyruvate kinase [Kiloniellales bacterium]|nr:pyruvate kinase [Kiloniellales bacterium]
MRRQRKAKIIATLGPATSDASAIKALFEAGADVFRLNFSHGERADHEARVASIRALEKEAGRPIGIVLDLQGPKLRIGKIDGGETDLVAGQPFRFDLEMLQGDRLRAPLPHPEIFAALEPGTILLVDDGKLRLQVEKCGKDFADTIVLAGGRLRDRKGVNLPGVILPISPLTEKDRSDLEFGLGLGVDWVALSFVQRPEDLEEAKALIAGRAPVMIKIEKPAAISCLDQLVAMSDAVMVARGDLGVELPPEDVPGLQKDMIRACRLAGKPVVVATQMLESMIASPAPTRAEASDVATAVYDGADCVMLSAETAIGEHPVEAVAMMDRIIASTEQDRSYRRILHALHSEPEATAADAISAAAAQVAGTIDAAAIVSYTMSGSTALRAARERPVAPIIVLTNNVETARRLALLWGAHCVHTEDVKTTTEMADKARRLAVKEGFAGPGARLVVTAGMPFGTPGTTNLLRIARIKE